MCVAFWSLTHSDYALYVYLACLYTVFFCPRGIFLILLVLSILCTNRDEYLDRPTAPAHFHSFERDDIQGAFQLASEMVLVWERILN